MKIFLQGSEELSEHFTSYGANSYILWVGFFDRFPEHIVVSPIASGSAEDVRLLPKHWSFVWDSNEK